MAEPFPRVLTFDCFGTLVDWRRGQREALATLPGMPSDRERLDAIEAARMRAEQRLQRGRFRPYREILAGSLAEAAREVLGRAPADEACAEFARRQVDWPPFPDTPAALARLARLAEIGLLSNCDRAVLEACARRHLGITPQWLIGAEDAGSYKPAPGHWRAFLAASGRAPEEVLHVSAYDHYDLRPAHALGFPVAFVARDGERAPDDVPLRFRARDLDGLADLLEAARAETT